MDLHVSPNGDDANPGDAERPLRTLHAARDRLRVTPRPLGEAHRVILREGTHGLAGPLELTAADSHTAFLAADGERPVLSGWAAVGPWRPVDAADLPVAPSALGKLFVAPLPAGARPGRLRVNGEPQPLAAFPATDDWERWPPAKKVDDHTVELPPDLPRRHATMTDVTLNVLPTPWTKWKNDLNPVVSIEGGRVRLRERLSVNDIVQATDEIPVRVENCLEALREPGQWCYDSGKGLLYYWPLDGTAPADAAVAAAPGLVRIHGTDADVAGVALQGLIFTGTGDLTGAAVTVANVTDLTVADCAFEQLAGSAVAVRGASRRALVRGCRIEHCGAEGVTISGPANPAREVRSAGHLVERCEIAFVGERKWNAKAIAVGAASHCVIRGNSVHDVPYAAITVSGARMIFTLTASIPPHPDRLSREDIPGIEAMSIVDFKQFVSGYNVVEGNRVERSMLRLDDGAAIYCHASHHDVVRGNVVIDARRNRSHALYFDDDQTDSLMEGNLVLDHLRQEGPGGSAIHVHDNARNTIRRNVVLGTQRPYTFPRAYGGQQVTGNVFVLRTPWHAPIVPKRNDGRYSQIRWDAGPNLFDGNCYWSEDGGVAAAQLLAHLRAQGVEVHGAVCDPGVSATDAGELRVAEGSWAHRAGIEALG